MQKRILAAVEEQLVAKGLTIVENGPGDLVWRANASDTVKDNSDKTAKTINTVVTVLHRGVWGETEHTRNQSRAVETFN